MTSLFGKIFGNGRSTEKPSVSPGDAAYAEAMTISDGFLDRMQAASRSTDAARSVMADVWAQNNNVPFMTAVVETVQEMKAPLEQRPEDLP